MSCQEAQKENETKRFLLLDPLYLNFSHSICPPYTDLYNANILTVQLVGQQIQKDLRKSQFITFCTVHKQVNMHTVVFL